MCCRPQQAVEQIAVVIRAMGNGVDRLVSSVAMVGVPTVPAYARALDLDDARVRDFLFEGARREGFDIPVDNSICGAVWDSDNETHVRAWLA